MKAVAVTLKQERALVGAVSVIVQLQTSRRFVWSSSLGHAAIDWLRQRVLVRRLGVRQVVHGDGEEDVEEDVVTADEQEDEVDADQAAETLEMLEIIDIIIDNLDILYQPLCRHMPGSHRTWLHSNPLRSEPNKETF